MFLHGTEVEIVGRFFEHDPLAPSGEPPTIELTWVDARYGLDTTGRFPDAPRAPAEDRE